MYHSIPKRVRFDLVDGHSPDSFRTASTSRSGPYSYAKPHSNLTCYGSHIPSSTHNKSVQRNHSWTHTSPSSPADIRARHKRHQTISNPIGPDRWAGSYLSGEVTKTKDPVPHRRVQWRTSITPYLSAFAPELIPYNFLNHPKAILAFCPSEILKSPVVAGTAAATPFSIRITTPTGHFCWTLSLNFRVAPSVWDFVAALYTALRVQVTAEEYNYLTPDRRDVVARAYSSRCALAGREEREEIEKRKGVKRIDFLVGKTRFKGVVGGGNVLQLYLS